MFRKTHLFVWVLLTTCIACIPLSASRNHRQVLGNYENKNDIPPRLQWNGNHGYCGEVSLISAGLYYGQYISQYDARACVSEGAQQNKDQLLLGVNDLYAASKMHLKVIKWHPVLEKNTNQFLTWVKKNVMKGYPVAIGIYTNENRFYGNADPNAGDKQYDHIVPVTGIASNFPSDLAYHGDDVIFFSDNGLWCDNTDPHYLFNYSFDAFQMSRIDANQINAPVYSLCNSGKNYGLAVTGVRDGYGETLPVRISTNFNSEQFEIDDGSNERPSSAPLTLTITVSNLVPHVRYILYRYNSLEKVPNSLFNAHAADAYESWPIQISSGNSYEMIVEIESDEIAVYRAVRAK